MHANTQRKASKGTTYSYKCGRKEIHKCLVVKKTNHMNYFHSKTGRRYFMEMLNIIVVSLRDEIRNEIVKLLRLKKSETHDLNCITSAVILTFQEMPIGE